MNIKSKNIKYLIVFLLFITAFAMICKLLNLHALCPIRMYLHVLCPGCGGTRCIQAIIHGNFYQAFRWNPMVFIMLFFLPFLLLQGFCIINITSKKLIKIDAVFLIIILVSEILFGILRNIPYFSFLAPTQV